MPTPITLTTPLPEADLRFDSMQHSAGVSMLEETQLFLLSEKPELAPEKLLGQTVDLQIKLRDGELRHICGYVTRFGIGRHQGRYFGYLAEVRPWLWFLTRTSDCRIFQEMTVPDIVKKVFADYGDVAAFEFKLDRSYRKRDYCVQYRETDFNFVARLMEDEGIFWYFEHDAGEHKLVVVDAPGALSALPHADSLPYYGNTGQASPDIDIVTDWNFAREVRPGKVALRSYWFETPSTSLEVSKGETREHDQAEYELYDYQGDYFKKSDGEQIARVRLDEAQARHEQLSGSTNACGLANGRLFTLTRHPREDQNAEYFVVQTQISASVNSLESGNEAGEYRCRFTAIPSGQPYRPPRRTPKPFVQGPQSAVVTGPGGEEIFTDKYGRVKVQFHWDRYGKKNETSSCWMRVSHPWAGKSFGMIHLPRIGQEVIVDFLEGDPDQPLITGRVYNAEQMPPWELPANATQSGILTRSSKGGAYGNANALRFEDKKGAEQVWLHAEKNQDIEVENDETHWVGHDRKKTIDHDETTLVKHDRTETVDNDETITIHHDRTERVDNNENISIGVNRAESVGKNETIAIGNNRMETVNKNESISIGGNRTESVSGNESVSVGKNRSMDVAQDETLSVGKNRKHTVGKDETIAVTDNLKHTIGKNVVLEIGEKRETKVGKDDLTQVGGKFALEAADEIMLKTGDASITMKKDGTIQIKGKDITVTGSGKITVKASGQMTLKGSKIAEN
jgi:type VI secretion system secreted protein VgrG